jgi:hypothetical protein
VLLRSTGAAGKSCQLCGPATTSNGHRFSIFFVRRARGEEEIRIHVREVTGARPPRPCMGPPRHPLPHAAAPNQERGQRKKHTMPPSKTKLGKNRADGDGMRKEANEFKGREGMCQQKHVAKINNTIIIRSQAKTNTKRPQLAHRISHHPPNQSKDWRT